MKYISTRGSAPELQFEDVLLTGLARDGGLYLPDAWPQFSRDDLLALRGRPYSQIAYEIVRPFVAGAIGDDDLRAMTEDAYAPFRHAAVAPLKQLNDNQWLLELFHGPTLAFKDFAMQLLSRLMDHVLDKRNLTATIIGATSGDTGSAAIEAFRESRRTKIFILHPNGRVSDVQRRQMTTVLSDRVFNIAVEGHFDDCQAHVKAMFNDLTFRDELSLSGVNSINWARIMAQIVYYFTSALALGGPDRPVSFTVPTGNFGDIFAGYAAKRMGLPVGRLAIATNVNDILDRTLKSGRYEVRGVEPSTSPSMDIQVSSNFERLLFEAYGRDPGSIRQLMSGLAQSGAFTVADDVLAAMRQDFESARTDEETVAATLKQTLAETGELLDPHTAVGYAVARSTACTDIPMVTLATAHPAKFPEAVSKASGVVPQLPAGLSGLMQREERFTVLNNDLAQIQQFVRDNAGT